MGSSSITRPRLYVPISVSRILWSVKGQHPIRGSCAFALIVPKNFTFGAHVNTCSKDIFSFFTVSNIYKKDVGFCLPLSLNNYSFCDDLLVIQIVCNIYLNLDEFSSKLKLKFHE